MQHNLIVFLFYLGNLDPQLNRTSSPAEGNDVTLVNPSSPLILESPKIPQSRNILANVLKRNTANKVVATSANPQYSVQNRTGETMQNIMVSQSSSRNTIHYTVVDPSSNVLEEGLNSMAGDMVERVVKHDDYASPRSVMSPLTSSINNSNVGGENPQDENPPEGPSQEQQQIIIVPGKTQSSPSQTDANKKSVFNHQKITMVVHNDGGNTVEVFENPQGNNKLSELLFRNDQKTCITFRAIKRTQSDTGQEEVPSKKRGNPNPKNETEEKDVDGSKSGENPEGAKGNDSTTSETCEYLVLESVADPSGTLPKFNQAFGKSYQVNIKPCKQNI